MDTRIALAGTPIDFAGSMTNGLNAGMMQRQAQQQNALAQLYQTQGPQIMAGNPQALNALAQMNPNAALGVQQSVLGVQTSQFQLQQVKDQAREHAAAVAAKMTADQAAAESAKLGTILQGAAAAPDEATYNGWLMQNGVNPADHPFAQRDLWVAAGLGAKDALDIQSKRAALTAGPDPLSPEGKLQADLRAGRITQQQFDTATAPKGPQTVINNIPAGDQTPKESNQATAGDTIWRAAKTARELVGSTSTGLIGMAMGNLPTSDAAEVKRQVAVLKSNASVAGIQAMREASKTGGAVGSPSDKDMAILQDKAGALDPNAGPERFQQQLDDYERTLFRITYGQKNGDLIFDKTRDGTSPLDVQLPDATGATSGGDQLSPEAQKLLEQWQ